MIDVHLKFGDDSGFRAELKRRVDDHFRQRGVSPRGGPLMYLKAAVILLWFGASYTLLVFFATSWWQAVPLAASLALSIGAIGFAVQHDANHGALSASARLNRWMGAMLDLMGASSYVWRWKHNVFHHTYTNVSGADDDVDIRPVARLAPAQPHRSFHRFQHVYMWGLYGFLVPKWQLIDDATNLAQGRIGAHRFPRPSGWPLGGLIAGKVVFLGWAFVVPALLHPWWTVLAFYFLVSFAVGLLLSVVFQLAHCVEETTFPLPLPGTAELAGDWAAHQVRTTANFAPGNRLLTWYLGGLNYQVEHHLFPRICHLHYPRLAPIVRAVCAEFGLPYTVQLRLRDALASHLRWLWRMGQPAGEAAG